MTILKIDPNFIIGIISVIIAFVAILATYHIARRQGVFKAPTIEIQPTFQHFLPPHRKYLKYPWLLVNSCHLSSEKGKNELLIYLPLLLRNNSKTSLENISVTLMFDSIYSTSHLGNNLVYSDLQKHTNVLRRFHDSPPIDYCTTIYEIPLLTSKNGIQILEPLLFDPIYISQKITDIENKVFKDEKDFAILRVQYQVSAKNLENSARGYFWVLSTQDTNIENFLQAKKKYIDKLLELTDPNWTKLHKRKYFVPWPYKFFGRLFYPNLGLRYNVNLKEIMGYSFIKDSKKTYAVEALEMSRISWGILTVPFSVGQ